MIIAYSALEKHLQKKCAALYFVTGTDLYLFHQAVRLIKQTWQKQTQNDNEETILTVQQSTDWATIFEDAQTYALFTTHRLLDIRFDKKTIDAQGKKQIEQYLAQPNLRHLLIIQAPSLPGKQLQSLASHPQIVHTHVLPYTPQMFKNFIGQRLQNAGIRFETVIPEMIHQYHQSNLLACHQFLEQLALLHDTTTILNPNLLLTYLKDQSTFSIYELADACLNGQSIHALHILRQIQQAQEEPILILWSLSQEIRKLLQLSHLQQHLSLQSACQKLKIWAQKIPLYQKASQRLSQQQWSDLLKTCQTIDEQLKTSRDARIWDQFEQLVMMFCGSFHLV